jgi:hypothetical protein
MLKTLALKHFDFVKRLIVDGTTIGAFDPQLQQHDRYALGVA